jgi:hypothetical protein
VQEKSRAWTPLNAQGFGAEDKNPGSSGIGQGVPGIRVEENLEFYQKDFYLVLHN